MRRILFLFIAAVMVAPALVQAQTSEPAVMLHIDAPITKSVCLTYPRPADCDAITVESTAGDGTQYNVYLVAATTGGNVEESFAAAEISIYYTEDENNFALLNWSGCADQEFPSDGWSTGPVPVSGSSNKIIFDAIGNCQSDPVVLMGFFIVGAYGDSQMSIGPHGSSGALKVANCSNAESTIENTRGGYVGFGTMDGCNSCLTDCITPVEEETWGGIKRAFGGE